MHCDGHDDCSYHGRPQQRLLFKNISLSVAAYFHREPLDLAPYSPRSKFATTAHNNSIQQRRARDTHRTYIHTVYIVVAQWHRTTYTTPCATCRARIVKIYTRGGPRKTMASEYRCVSSPGVPPHIYTYTHTSRCIYIHEIVVVVESREKAGNIKAAATRELLPQR